jgi:methyltransferase-like protein/protein-L-isoaspartate O-methyltransferase
MTAADSYDLVRYPSPTFPQTHPDRLACAAVIGGMEPARPERCRYLEVGCGTGINIIAMAATLPGSEFVGVDLAAKPIEEADAVARELGLTNVRFINADIRALGADLGDFDYIVAHGVYSWVPAPVRDGMLTLYRERLRPQGIGYISYNTYPGCHAREMVRRMMRYHVRALAAPMERVEQGRALIQFLASAGAAPEPYPQMLAKELTHLQTAEPGLIYHDDLADINDPCYFHEFVAHAGKFGLQYLAEAVLHEMQDRTYAAPVVATLRQLDEDPLAKEQYLDFIKGRRFRQSLLCHAAIPVDRRGQQRALARLRFASDAEQVATAAGAAPGAATWKRSNKAEATTAAPAALAAMRALIEAWPLTLGFGELASRAASVGPAEELAATLNEFVAIGLVDARLDEVPCVAEPGPRPCAGRVARYQAARGTIISTLRHTSVRLEDPAIRALLGLLDGERDQAAIAAALSSEIVQGRVPAPPGVTVDDPAAVAKAVAAHLPQLLRRAAKLSLLTA